MEKELYDLLAPTINELGYKCVEITFRQVGTEWHLTAFIDKEGDDISLDDCELVSNAISPILDEVDPIEQSYFLDVSSPGIERPLKTIEDYQVGEEITIKTKQRVEDKRRFIGIIKKVLEDSFVLETEGKEIEFELSNIKEAKPYITVQ